MPRKKFRLASDADNRIIDCYAFYRENGRPMCCALNHPYCLQLGGSVENCSFHMTNAEYKEKQKRCKRG